MRRLAMLALVVLLGIVPAILQGTPAAGQEAPTATPSPPAGEPRFGMVEENGWLQVGKPVPRDGQATVFDGTRLQPYDVFFNEQYAAAPEVKAAPTEFMIVQVVDGEFALDVTRGSFVVNRPNDTAIEYLEKLGDEGPPHYRPNGKVVRDEAGDDCRRICAIPEQTAVLLKPGDRAIAQAESICIWCLLHAGTGIHPGQLLVYTQLPATTAVDEGFSWVQDWEQEQGASVASQAGLAPVLLGWAYFHPQARCRGGG